PSHVHRDRPTPTRPQRWNTGHLLHHGDRGLHVLLPCVTRSGLYSLQYSCGRMSRKSLSVSSGVLVLTAPSLLEMRWTWVSTAMPGRPKPSVITILAVFRPTPLMVSSSSRVSGTMLWYFSMTIRE